MRCLAAAVSSGRDIPQPLRAWLSKCLRRATTTGNANAAFRLKPGAGRRAEYVLHMNDAAQLHALAQWHARSISNSAGEVENLFGREASVLAKNHHNVARKWTISGPYVADAEGQPTCELASQKDLAHGVLVVVVFTSKTVESHRFVLLLPQELAGIGAPAPSRNRSSRK